MDDVDAYAKGYAEGKLDAQEELNALQGRLDKGIQMYKDLKHEYELIRHNHKSIVKPKKDIIEIIYQAYPKQRQKPTATYAIEQAILDLANRGNTAESLLERVRAYAKTLKRFGVDNKSELWKFVPAPHKWFGEGRYDWHEADWSESFRDGRYIEEEKEVEEKDVPKLEEFRKALGALFPSCEPHKWTYRKFKMWHPSDVPVIKEWILKNNP